MGDTMAFMAMTTSSSISVKAQGQSDRAVAVLQSGWCSKPARVLPTNGVRNAVGGGRTSRPRDLMEEEFSVACGVSESNSRSVEVKKHAGLPILLWLMLGATAFVEPERALALKLATKSPLN